MKIVGVRTTVLRQPWLAGIQDATIRHRDAGRSALFVQITTDAGIEGLGVGTAAARGIIETSLKPLLVDQDPPCHEKSWHDMFWRVRGHGRKGVAFCAISAVDNTDFPDPRDWSWSPYPDRLGRGLGPSPGAISNYAV